MIKISVVIPAYGPCSHLDTVLTAIFQGTKAPDQVIVSHSGPDNPLAEMQRKFSTVLWLHSDQRLFAGAARNAGSKISTGEVLAFCDSDVVPCETWLQNIEHAFLQHKKLLLVGAVGVQKSGGYWGMSNWICEFSEQAPWRPKRQQSGGASCNMAISANDFRAIGGFPEHLTRGEDTTFFKKGRVHGLKQIFKPEIRVGHINNDGFIAFVRHQYAIGQSFAVTRQDQNLPGKTFIRIPLLTPLLWIPKSILVLKRAFLSGGKGLKQGLFLAPGILIGGLIFTLGASSKVFGKQT